LEVNGRRAVDLKLADATAQDRAELAERYGLRESGLILLETSWVDTTVMVLNSWPMTTILFVVGLIALYVELSAPGTSVGGLIAGLCFALFFWSRFLGGTSGWLEVVFFLAGVVFLLVELFVIPGFGIAGIAGVLLIITSVLMASQNFSPTDGLSTSALTQSVFILAGSGVAAVAAAIAITSYFGTIPVLNRLALKPPVLAQASAQSDSSKQAEQARHDVVAIGDHGIADSPLRPAGRALFGDQYVDVVTDGSFVDPGRPVRVVKISGNRVMVREAKNG
jgi:membrane-bound serine protease (ClpP class)